MSNKPDAVIIGSGPNGLAAGITLARAGLKVVIREGHATAGGGMRSASLTLPGFVHDVCSTVQALARVSPFFRSIPLDQLGVTFCEPPAPFAHALDGGDAAICERSVQATAAGLGADGKSYERLFAPLVEDWDRLIPTLLGPPYQIPRAPVALARFGWNAIRSVRSLADAKFTSPAARALFAGVAAHAILPFDFIASASFGMVLTASAHAVGWPVVKGGSGVLADALVRHFQSLGGSVETSAPVTTLDEFAGVKAILADVAPRNLVKIAGAALPHRYQKRLNAFRYGPGVFKIDYALSQPIPWKNPALLRAGTIHLGGTFEEIARSEGDSWQGRQPANPYVLLVQSSLFDPTRARAGQHTAWAYMHVPHGTNVDLTNTMETQIERFAPGFRECVLARAVRNGAQLEAENANLIGGDITGGANMFSQLFTRPVRQINPYRTPVKGLYLCSASTPPGGGVHGMCGVNAAKSALKHEFGM